ncbi:AMP-binding enzyme [Prevotella multiformis DSM 16608]|uniref:AMP-binding enzyme n=2 Tax=Prevotella multiformis TaxID=282402 RepID=F0F3X0_9BACT|nr:AMP-binding enzyme [Prevotella multiformis DSM 16608]
MYKVVSAGVSGIGGQTGISDLPAGRLLPFLKTNIQNNKMIERYLTQTQFSSEEDFREHLHFIVPDTFNFAYDVMDEWAKEAPDKLALLWTSERGEEVKTTFAGFKEQTDRTAAYFLSLGISRGDKVMLILKRHYQWWLAMMALCKIGAVAIPATHMLTKKDIVYRNRRASVKAIICVNDEYVTTQVRQSVLESPTVEVLVAVNSMVQRDSPVPEGFHDWHKEWPEAPAFVRPEEVNTNGDTMLMYFTSGTSGEPKMVAHDYLYALGHLVTGVFWHNLDGNGIHLTVADTGWGKAVWGKLYGQWFAGATVFVYDHEKFTAGKIMRVMEKYRVTSFCAPPTIYRFMIQEDFAKYDLSALEYCTTAGEALEPAVYQKFFNLTGIRMMEGFGQTETTMTLGTFPWIKPKPGSMGKPNPQYDIRLLKPDGSVCEDGEKGEICIDTSAGKPIGLFKGYYRDPELTERAWHDGLYYTGDIAWRDEDGYYWFVGRADDVIKSSGYRIGPFEVESALMTHPAVVECAVTGVPDVVRGMVVKATIVLADEWRSKAGDALVKELQNHVKHETAPYKYPRIIEFVDALPKTISGKIRRVEIRERDNR